MAELEFIHVHKRYGNKTYAIRDFNLKVYDGEFVVLVGPSGCGKTTLLRMVAGLEEITAGELLMDGRVINDVEPQNRGVAMAFQNYSLFPNMSVYENMEFALKMRKTPKKERKEKVLEMAKLLGIDDILDRKAKRLSGGQCQRIAIGRALVCNPSFFLLDEPLSNLDTQMRMQLKDEIARVQKDLRVTTLYVTHDQVEAMSLGDRIVVIKDGEIQQADTPQNLYYKPANVFVAKYIGQRPMNFFHASCEMEGFAVKMKTDFFQITIPRWKVSAIEKLGYLGKTVLAGIRTENIYFDENEAKMFTDGELCSCALTVKSIELLGNSTVLHLNMDGETIIAENRKRADYRPGMQVTVYMDIDMIHVFDSESGEAVAH